MKLPSILQIEEITKSFSPTASPAVDHVTLALKTGSILGLLGPSGCGKTTLLRIIAGFEQAQGCLRLNGTLVCGQGAWVAPEHRSVGMVFQDFALFPHLTVGDNVGFGLQSTRKSDDGSRRIAEVMNLVGLQGMERRYPHELSGGQQQRVALARALAPQPSLVLLDEPLSNLDVQVRLRLRQELRDILKTAGTSAVFVTHDQEEAMAIADQVAVMRAGKLEQVGTPEDIYQRPQSQFVAEFVTQANFLRVQRQDNVWQTEVSGLAIICDQFAIAANPTLLGTYATAAGIVMIRQEDLQLRPDAAATTVIRDRQFLGREYRYCLQTDSGKELHARTNIGQALAIGTPVQLSLATQNIQIFPDLASPQSSRPMTLQC
jgi:iron(III) transport system ATP-binding protein